MSSVLMFSPEWILHQRLAATTALPGATTVVAALGEWLRPDPS
jgi:hypothetical protein